MESEDQLPDTQKIGSDYSSCEAVDSDMEQEPREVWGRLYPLGFNLEPLDLTKNVYHVGRGPSCDVQITGKHLDASLLTVISKIQFKLELEIDNSGARIFSLVDLSSNGTYVNKKKIGKNNKIFLSNMDEIALSLPQNKAYLFLDGLTNDSWLPTFAGKNYTIITRLGIGAFGEVKLAVDKNSGKRFAIKKILKNACGDNNDKNYVVNETKILRALNHECTIKMEDLFENDDSMFIVLEYMPGGDLQQKIDNVQFINEKDGKFFFYQLILALQYLHRNGIIHRDLKPKNVLLSSNSPDALLKISDFGLSKVIKSESTLLTFCGTLLYTAPEILLSRGCIAYTPLVDIWSLGCILYLCLSSKPPFNRDDKMSIQEQIVRGFYKRLNCCKELEVSKSAIDLVDKMLIVNPSQRIAIDDILVHPWLQDKKMKSRVKNVFKNVGKENLENVTPDFENPCKRQRTEMTVTMTS